MVLRGIAGEIRLIAEELQRQADEKAHAASGADTDGEAQHGEKGSLERQDTFWNEVAIPKK